MCVCMCDRERETKREPKREYETERKTERDRYREERKRRGRYLLLMRLCSHMLAPPKSLAATSIAVVLAYARADAVLALASNAVVLAHAAGPVAHESVHICISGE